MNTNNSVSNKQNIIIVNTGSEKKKYIIKKIKKLGYNLIVVNSKKNWAKPYVDHWIITDNKNHNQALSDIDNFINSHPEIKIHGALTFWEDDVLLTSRITDKLNLVGIPYKISKIIRNKYLFRAFCRANNIASPQHALIKTEKELEDIKVKFQFPVVIKPTHGSSSAFVVKAENSEQLDNIYKYIKTNISTRTESALHESAEIFVEEYIDGEEVDIDILLQNGKIKFYSISDNYKAKEPFFIETGFAIPSSLPEDKQHELINLAETTLEKLGVQNGCIHFEAKATKSGVVPIEVNLRIGGDEVYYFIKNAWRVDLIENMVKISCGEYVEKIDKQKNPYKYMSGMDLIPENSGILVNFTNNNLKFDKDYHSETQIFKKIGDAVLVPPEGYEYLGWITATGSNPVEAEENLREVRDNISYELVKFDSSSSVGKTKRLNRFSSASMNMNIIRRASKIEKIRKLTIADQRKLHIGIVCNIYDDDGSVENTLTNVGRNIEKALLSRGYKVTFFDFNHLINAINEIKESDVNLIFNVCERLHNSSLLEPHAASILDAIQMPYTGSNPFTLALCLDKIRVKKLLAFHNIPTPKWDYAYNIKEEIDPNLKYPLIVKPANSDNSIGITNDSIVTNPKELKKQLENIINILKRPALVEEYIEGDEYDVSILGSEEDDLRVLPLSRSVFNMPKGYWNIYPFDAKYASDSKYKQNIEVQRPPKNISKKLESLISEIALDTYNILDCHDYGRIEIRVDKNNNPYVLELNPNPSINIGDCVPSVAELLNMNYADFIEEIIRMCIKRYKNRPPYYHLQANLL